MKYQLYNFTDEVPKRVGPAVEMTKEEVNQFNNNIADNELFLPPDLSDDEANYLRMINDVINEDHYEDDETIISEEEEYNDEDIMPDEITDAPF